MHNFTIQKVSRFNYIDLEIALFIVTGWLWANLTSLQWLYESILQTAWLNKLLLMSGIGILATWMLIQGKFRFSYSAPVVRSEPLILIVTTAIAMIALQWTIELPQVNALLFLLGSYGIWGLFVESTVWRQRLAIAFIISIVLPFSLQFTSGLGFTARILTAHAVENILNFLQVAAISSSDIIVLENGIAHVDLPCSGLRSLWTGTIFLLGATWLEGRILGFRWLIVYVGSLGLLILANVGRVLLLTIISVVLNQSLIAELIHIPLGVMSFIGACGLGWLALRFVPQNAPKKITKPSFPEVSPTFNRIPLIALLIGIVIFASIPRPHLNPMSWVPIVLPTTIKTEPIALTTIENEFFANNAIVSKQRFEFGNLSGSMLFVNSNSWNTHHPPELCFTGNGFTVDTMESKQFAQNFPLRWLTLENSEMSGMYWFQSRTQTTDEFLNRLWSEISFSDRTWVMVSILFDRAQSPDNPEVQSFANSIRGSLFAENSQK